MWLHQTISGAPFDVEKNWKRTLCWSGTVPIIRDQRRRVLVHDFQDSVLKKHWFLWDQSTKIVSNLDQTQKNLKSWKSKYYRFFHEKKNVARKTLHLVFGCCYPLTTSTILYCTVLSTSDATLLRMMFVWNKRHTLLLGNAATSRFGAGSVADLTVLGRFHQIRAKIYQI